MSSDSFRFFTRWVLEIDLRLSFNDFENSMSSLFRVSKSFNTRWGNTQLEYTNHKWEQDNKDITSTIRSILSSIFGSIFHKCGTNSKSNSVETILEKINQSKSNTLQEAKLHQGLTNGILAFTISLDFLFFTTQRNNSLNGIESLSSNSTSLFINW